MTKFVRDRMLLLLIEFPLMTVGTWAAILFAADSFSGVMGSDYAAKASQKEAGILQTLPLIYTILAIGIVVVPLVGLIAIARLTLKEGSDIRTWKLTRSLAGFTIANGLAIIAVLFAVGITDKWQDPPFSLATIIAIVGGLYTLFYLIYGVYKAERLMKLVSLGEPIEDE